MYKDKVLQARGQPQTNMNLLIQKEFLTAREAASYLGISINSMYKLTQRRAIPIYKPGHKKVYIRKKDIDEWIAESIQQSTKQQAKKASQYLLKTK
jgi:excisionase family DNA binding protein